MAWLDACGNDSRQGLGREPGGLWGHELGLVCHVPHKLQLGGGEAQGDGIVNGGRLLELARVFAGRQAAEARVCRWVVDAQGRGENLVLQQARIACEPLRVTEGDVVPGPPVPELGVARGRRVSG